MSSDQDREDFIKKLDKLLQQKVEFKFISKLKAFFKSVAVLISSQALSLMIYSFKGLKVLNQNLEKLNLFLEILWKSKAGLMLTLKNLNVSLL